MTKLLKNLFTFFNKGIAAVTGMLSDSDISEFLNNEDDDEEEQNNNEETTDVMSE